MKLQRMLSLATLLVATTIMSAQAVSPTPPQQKSAAVTSAAAKPSSSPLDINTASPDQLKQLTGIGDAYSKRIIDGRPYAAKTQLMSRGILPKATYDGIAGQIIAKRTK